MGFGVMCLVKILWVVAGRVFDELILVALLLMWSVSCV